jgi:hypothetical protein
MNFRTWCREKWYEHIDEMVTYTGNEPSYNSREYFAKYKYWLKREFKFQQRTA